MSWLESSIMAKKAVAHGRPGKQYAITEASQGKYHYVYGPYAEPVLTVAPGSIVSASAFLQPEPHVHLAVHRRRSGEMLLCLLPLAQCARRACRGRGGSGRRGGAC